MRPASGRDLVDAGRVGDTIPQRPCEWIVTLELLLAAEHEYCAHSGCLNDVKLAGGEAYEVVYGLQFGKQARRRRFDAAFGGSIVLFLDPEQVAGHGLKQANSEPAHDEVGTAVGSEHLDCEATPTQFCCRSSRSHMLQRERIRGTGVTHPSPWKRAIELVLVDHGAQDDPRVVVG